MNKFEHIIYAIGGILNSITLFILTIAFLVALYEHEWVVALIILGVKGIWSISICLVDIRTILTNAIKQPLRRDRDEI